MVTVSETGEVALDSELFQELLGKWGGISYGAPDHHVRDVLLCLQESWLPANAALRSVMLLRLVSYSCAGACCETSHTVPSKCMWSPPPPPPTQNMPSFTDPEHLLQCCTVQPAAADPAPRPAPPPR
jgi:hypothetical protein